VTARVSIGDGRLRIQRTGVARWFGSSVDVPLAHVDSVSSADPHEVKRWNKGIRLAGIQLPGLMTSGLYRQGGQLTWWDVGRGSSALVVTIHDERLTRVIVEVGDPGVMRELVQAFADAALPTEPTVR
jgi:hypothetical protein